MSKHDAGGQKRHHWTADGSLDARDRLAGRYDDTTVRQAVEVHDEL